MYDKVKRSNSRVLDEDTPSLLRETCINVAYIFATLQSIGCNAVLVHSLHHEFVVCYVLMIKAAIAIPRRAALHERATNIPLSHKGSTSTKNKPTNRLSSAARDERSMRYGTQDLPRAHRFAAMLGAAVLVTRGRRLARLQPDDNPPSGSLGSDRRVMHEPLDDAVLAAILSR